MNSFGTTSVQYPLYNSRETRESRIRFRREAIPELRRANSFYCPSGRWPCRGWLLLTREDYNKLDKYSNLLQLQISNTNKPDNVLPLSGISIIQARCVTRGIASDPNALYLVEITDNRGVLYNEWFQFPLTAAYNIRAPAYPQTFYPYSLNGGTTWTWSTMIQDMWTSMSALLGTWPGLPITPTGTPEGFFFSGVSAWSALNDILDYLGLEVSCDLTQTNPYTIVNSGAADTSFDSLKSKYTTNLEDDLEYIDLGAARVPKTVEVLFRRRNSVFGTEETTPYRSDVMAEQWLASPYHTVFIDAPATFSSAIGTHYIWSDFTIRYDQDSNPLGDDVTIANAIAQERVLQYFGRIYNMTLGSLHQTYAGALPFATGSLVDGVCWYQDDRNLDDRWHGWRTQLIRGVLPPWPDLYDD